MCCTARKERCVYALKVVLCAISGHHLCHINNLITPNKSHQIKVLPSTSSKNVHVHCVQYILRQSPQFSNL